MSFPSIKWAKSLFQIKLTEQTNELPTILTLWAKLA